MDFINEKSEAKGGKAEKAGSGVGGFIGNVLRAGKRGLVDNKKTRDKKADPVSKATNFVGRGLNQVGGGIVDFIKGAGKGAWKSMTEQEKLMVHLYATGLVENMDAAYDLSLHLSEGYSEYFHSIIKETYED